MITVKLDVFPKSQKYIRIIFTIRGIIQISARAIPRRNNTFQIIDWHYKFSDSLLKATKVKSIK